MRRLGAWIGLAAVVLWSLAPFAWQVLTSLKPYAELETLPPLLPGAPTLAHYHAILAGQPFGQLMLNSLVAASGATLLALLFGSLAGFALAKLRPPGRAATLAAAVTLSMLPPIATVSPLFLLTNAAGLHDTLAALVLVYAGFALPLAVWLMTQFFRGVPDELYVAARVDGCSAAGAFVRVMLPLAVPGLVATGLLVFVFAWNEFLYALSLTASTASRTVPVGIALFPGIHEVPWGEIAAGSVVATAPVVLLAIVFQRRVLEGLTAGAVKG
ncbi:MAG TPA: carbohydrate ABC transporter permease [Burkholderiales bacterium]|nr:carbohydrate ABC transporter permease [Burkholderiales bacterium]